MPNFNKCKNCGEYGFVYRHKCLPEWEAVHVDWNDEDDPVRAFGVDAESAALSLSERYFSRWDHPEEMEIWVRKPGDSEWIKFDITVQAVPEFSATLIESH